MGLVVIFCYIQVLLVLPLALHIWHTVFRYCENCCYYPCSLLCRTSKTVTLPNVRLSELDNEDIEDGQPDIVCSEENESANLISDSGDDIHVADIHNPPVNRVVDDTIKKASLVDQMSSFLQLIMLYGFARPVLFFQLVRTNFGKLRIPLINMFCVWLYLLSLITSIGLVVGLLKFSDRPPQLFNSNSNIQKLLDLTGNLTENGALDCIGGCGGSCEFN